MNPTPTTAEATSYHPAPHTPIVLLVEDDSMLAHMYSEKFTIDGYQVTIAKDGEVAYQFLKSQHADCVLLDLYIPKVDGLSLLEKLRTEGITLPPVIALTNLAEPKHLQRAKELGVKEYLVKAMLTPEEVVMKVKTHILHH